MKEEKLKNCFIILYFRKLKISNPHLDSADDKTSENKFQKFRIQGFL